MNENSNHNKEKLFHKVWKALYEGSDMQDPSVREVIDRMHQIIQIPSLDEEKSFRKLSSSLQIVNNHRKFLLKSWIKYVAAVLLPLGCVICSYWFWNQDIKNSQHHAAYVRPDSAVILTLASGEEIQLDRNYSGNFRSTDVVNISQDSVEGLFYEARNNQNVEIRYNILSVPIAAEYRLKLSDGTVVYMNADSRLKYPEIFVGGDRTVYLEGEAYFEVAKDSKRPFKVVVKNVSVNVLGTHFNVNAYPENKHVVTTLAEGKVRVDNGVVQKILKPGNQAIASDSNMEVKDVDVREYTSWKNGLFMFHGMTLENVMMQVYRWYGIKPVFVHEELRTVTFTGIINKNVSVEKLFEVIEKVVDVCFVLGDNNEVSIYKK